MEKQDEGCEGCIMQVTNRMPLLCTERCKDHSFNDKKNYIINPIKVIPYDTKKDSEAIIIIVNKLNEIIKYINKES